MWGLYKHEHKYSVMHWSLTRNTEVEGDVKSKDPMILLLGPRIFRVNPIFSQNSQRGKGSNNVHKFERFLRHGTSASIASAYLPLTFGAQPAVLFKETSSSLSLIGSGTLMGPAPSRIIAKRIVLTGHPYKVHKTTATIRYMFHNRPDVEYFKPVQLKTKRGRIGHIREALGTHGLFKAGFDGGIDQMDTICMSLYKRCFPKWGTRWVEGEKKDEEVEI